MIKKYKAIHPGEILKELFLDELGLSAGQLARQLRVPRTRIERIVAGQTSLTVDTALRLAKRFNSTPEMWLNMQRNFDLQQAEKYLHAELKKIKPLDEVA